jgi:hypothetical protein
VPGSETCTHSGQEVLAWSADGPSEIAKATARKNTFFLSSGNFAGDAEKAQNRLFECSLDSEFTTLDEACREYEGMGIKHSLESAMLMVDDEQSVLLRNNNDGWKNQIEAYDFFGNLVGAVESSSAVEGGAFRGGVYSPASILALGDRVTTVETIVIDVGLKDRMGGEVVVEEDLGRFQFIATGMVKVSETLSLSHSLDGVIERIGVGGGEGGVGGGGGASAVRSSGPRWTSR